MRSYLFALLLLAGCTTPMVRPITPLDEHSHQVGASVESQQGYNLFYRYGFTDRFMAGVSIGTSLPAFASGRGAALLEAHYAIVRPESDIHLLSMSIDAGWQAWNDTIPAHDTGDISHAGFANTRGNRAIVHPGINYAIVADAISARFALRGELVHVFACDEVTPLVSCADNRPTKSETFINGLTETGFEIHLGRILDLFGVLAIATDKNIAWGGGIAGKFK